MIQMIDFSALTLLQTRASLSLHEYRTGSNEEKTCMTIHGLITYNKKILKNQPGKFR